MSKISIIIPTHDRPDLLREAIASVLAQTFRDWELIIVDDGVVSAELVVKNFGDSRIKYIKHEQPHQGGSASRNTGVKNSSCDFIAFLDDDDKWLPEKLQIQMAEFLKTDRDVGFCFSGVYNIFGSKKTTTQVPAGIGDYYELALRRFKGFLTVTLIIKSLVFKEIGLFDENLPSHQEIDLIIRIAKKFKGLGINKPLVLVSMDSGHESIGKSSIRRIEGRLKVLNKNIEAFKERPQVLSFHYFWVALQYRKIKNFKEARNFFTKAWQTFHKPVYLLHIFSMAFNGKIYSLFR